MIKSTYQLVVLGNESSHHHLMISTIYEKINELGLSRDVLEIINRDNFNEKYQSNNPVVGIYYGGNDYPDLDLVERLLEDASIILPVFDGIGTFNDEIPEILHQINGVKLESELDINSLVNNVLEGFSLLRISRRLFISYKRSESRGVAIQLYEQLEQAGYDVFLDTHSIRKGDVFQEELWHRLVDTDVVVLLNTHDFLTSKWTSEELAKADSMSIGILQLEWPENPALINASLSIPIKLHPEDFNSNIHIGVNSTLVDAAVHNVINQVESLRARSLAARQDNIITEFSKFARLNNRTSHLQPQKFITATGTDGKEIIVIPTIGVPHAFSYHQTKDLVETIRRSAVERLYLLYDHRNIREKWLNHLSWLDQYLPVKSVKITEIESWIKSNIQ